MGWRNRALSDKYVRGSIDSAKRSDGDRTLVGDTLALKLDTFNLMQRVRRQITFPTT
jgi:hypothetical protein